MSHLDAPRDGVSESDGSDAEAMDLDLIEAVAGAEGIWRAIGIAMAGIHRRRHQATCTPPSIPDTSMNAAHADIVHRRRKARISLPADGEQP
jgi:hypothetical protein